MLIRMAVAVHIVILRGVYVYETLLFV